MKADYFLGQAAMAVELQGFIENLTLEVGLDSSKTLEILETYLANKEKVTKELYLSVAPKVQRDKVLKDGIKLS